MKYVSLEMSCRECHDMLKENIENIKNGFTDKDVKELTFEEVMYILYYNGDNILQLKEDYELDCYICDNPMKIEGIREIKDFGLGKVHKCIKCGETAYQHAKNEGGVCSVRIK